MGLKSSSYSFQKRLAAQVRSHPFLLHWDTTVSGAKRNVKNVVKAALQEGVVEFVGKRKMGGGMEGTRIKKKKRNKRLTGDTDVN